MDKQPVIESLRQFKSRRDNLLHEDETTFDHNLRRFVEFCNQDPVLQSIISPMKRRYVPDAHAWWNALSPHLESIPFPSDPDEELLLRLAVLETLMESPGLIFNFGMSVAKRKRDDIVQVMRSIVVRPLVEELSHRLGDAVNLATPEARALQAVPLNRIPNSKEIKIFLSHKTLDKPIVWRYHNVLKALGFTPWLDDPDMPAGTNTERGLLQGFRESCAAVFFVTKNFVDENYLATELDYAMTEKREKGKKFAIITLRYEGAHDVPDLLKRYIYKNVTNDLEGFYELVRALPVELGAVRWKADVVDA